MFPEVAGGHWEALEEVDIEVDCRPGGASIRDSKHQQSNSRSQSLSHTIQKKPELWRLTVPNLSPSQVFRNLSSRWWSQGNKVDKDVSELGLYWSNRL